MITKETFCAALGQIMEQREIDEKVGAALESVGDGHFVFGCKNQNFLSPAAEKAGRTPPVRQQNATIGALCPCLGEGNLLHWAQKEAVR